MYLLGITLCLLAQPAGEAKAEPAPAVSESIQKLYRQDAEKYVFETGAEKPQALKLVEKPIMRWSNDDDWSGDVFMWTDKGVPAVVGCILSGPSGETNRIVFHEFHLLADKPLAPVELLTKRKWQPKEGLTRIPLADAPKPAPTAAARLTQMRQLTRKFTAHMEADGIWELRLLSQPLFHYGDEKGEVVDGALFAYVWTKGTDLEVILLLECRKHAKELVWTYAPVRFSNRQVWLKNDGKEVWRVAGHKEPGTTTDLIYTTAYARTAPKDSAKEPLPK
jgi:hypothetical protein